MTHSGGKPTEPKPARSDSPSSSVPRRFQILSLDGGGLRGLFSAAVLAELESDLDTTIADHFDLVVGTSTGGLIALALGAGLSPAQVVDFYVDQGSLIFPASRWRSLRRAVRMKYSNDPLRRALRAALGNRLLGDSMKRLVIPSYSLDADDVYLFKTPHHEHYRRDGRESMVDVGLATTAAPTYLPAARLRNLRLIDGGVWANNPTLVGVTEAISMLGCAPSDITVLSLGTTDPVSSRGGSLDRGGLVQWARPVPSVMLRAQAVGARHTADHLLGRGRVTRIDPTVPNGLFQLDRLDAGAIRGLAQDVSRRSSEFVQPFTSHLAAAYVPSGRSA